MVFYAHAWQLTGRLESWNAFLGSFAVTVFFVISGFLIAKSWETSNGTLRYAANRALRIFPALIVVVTFSALIIGPAFTSLSIKAYFSNTSTWRYLLSGLLIIQYTLPGVFTHNPQDDHVNAPLWTLPYEGTLYVVIAVIGLLSGRGFRFSVLATYLLLLALNLIDAANWHASIPYTVLMNGLEFAAYFFAGAVAWTFRKGFVLRWYLAIAAVLVLIFRAEIGCDGVIWFIALPYIVLWLGLRDLPQWRWLQHFRRNDYSYGLYIWGFLIQKSVVAVLGPDSLLEAATVAAALACTAAFASWHLVEKRCLALKYRSFGHPDPVRSQSEAVSETA